VIKALRTMSTSHNDSHKSASLRQPTQAERDGARRKQPLDATQLRVAWISAASAIVVALIGAGATFAAGLWHYSGPGAAALPTRTVTTTVSPVGPQAIPSTASSTPMSRPAPAATLYLADQTGITGGGAGDDSPESGKWTMAGTTYPHSIGYPGLGQGYGYVTFTLNGSYKYFIATVGVADSADPNDQSTTVTFEVDDGSGNELGSKAAQYGNPQVIKVPLQGITSLTLLTNAPAGFYADSNAFVAVWGDAQVVGLLKYPCRQLHSFASPGQDQAGR
jgi:NPCBM/NEW2 domain